MKPNSIILLLVWLPLKVISGFGLKIYRIEAFKLVENTINSIARYSKPNRKFGLKKKRCDIEPQHVLILVNAFFILIPVCSQKWSRAEKKNVRETIYGFYRFIFTFWAQNTQELSLSVMQSASEFRTGVERRYLVHFDLFIFCAMPCSDLFAFFFFAENFSIRPSLARAVCRYITN